MTGSGGELTFALVLGALLLGNQNLAAQSAALTMGDTILAPAGMHHYSNVNSYQAPRQQVSFPYGY